MQALREPPPAAVCPSCGEANDPGTDFCLRCGAPVGRFTTLDPFKAIFAEGWLFRKTASARIRPIVLVGMWALFGIPLAGMVAALALRPTDSHGLDTIATVAVSVLYLLVLARVTLNFLRNRPGPGPWDPDR